MHLACPKKFIPLTHFTILFQLSNLEGLFLKRKELLYKVSHILILQLSFNYKGQFFRLIFGRYLFILETFLQIYLTMYY